VFLHQAVDHLLLFQQFNEEAKTLLHEIFEATDDCLQDARCLVNESLLEDLLDDEITDGLNSHDMQSVREVNGDDLYGEMIQALEIGRISSV
jgi:hypothetical protein